MWWLAIAGVALTATGVIIALLAWLFPFDSGDRSLRPQPRSTAAPPTPTPPASSYPRELWSEVDLDRLGQQPGCVEYCDAIFVHTGPRPSRISPPVVVRDGERYRAICQDEGVEQWDNQGNRSTLWVKIEYERGRFGYINEVWFGFRGRVLVPCPQQAN
jgi:hypothetical protein